MVDRALAFLFSLVIISVLYMSNEVTPFGTKSLLCVDFYHQYGPMLGELFDRLHLGSNFIYSFNDLIKSSISLSFL